MTWAVKERSFFCFPHKTDRLRNFNFNVMEGAGLSCHCLSDNNIWYGVHFLLVLKAECHVLPADSRSSEPQHM